MTREVREELSNQGGRGWTVLIREFFSNFSCHVYDSNTLVRSWIRDVEFTITPRVMAKALGVSIFTDLVYPYDE